VLGKGISVGGPALAHALGELIRVSPLDVDHPLIVVAVRPICKVAGLGSGSLAEDVTSPRRTSGRNVSRTAMKRL